MIFTGTNREVRQVEIFPLFERFISHFPGILWYSGDQEQNVSKCFYTLWHKQCQAFWQVYVKKEIEKEHYNYLQEKDLACFVSLYKTRTYWNVEKITYSP